MSEWKCKHCIHHLAVNIEGNTLQYCQKRHFYPTPIFIKAWGCDEFEDRQLKLFQEEKRND